MEQGQFLFIEETGTGIQKSSTKTLIKTHVMDRVVSNKRSSLMIRTNVRRPGRKEHLLRQRLVNSGHLASLGGLDEMVRLAGLPVELHNANTKFLLHHFLNNHSRTMCTISSETGWLKYALEDGALFNSTIYYWAMLNYAVLPLVFQRPEYLIKLKGLVITKISSRLNAPNCHNDGALIAAIACLANLNLKLDKLDEAKVHFRGAMAMVRSRNGVSTLGFDGLIARLLKATDSFHAQLSNTTLSIEENTEPPEAPILAPAILVAWTHEDESTQLGVIKTLRSIAADLIASPKDTMSLEDQVRLGDRLLVADREILRYIHENNPSISTVVAIAALSYSHSFLRAMKPYDPVRRAAACRLKTSIIQTYTVHSEVFDRNPRELLWVLIVGVLVSEICTREYSWFHLCVKKACGNDSGRVMQSIQASISLENSALLPSYYWMLSDNWDDWLSISSINTRIL
ncbi:hypothetical protein BP6252_05889 [Coleophoma cylindrospora]|uniref:Transcription factor domain-containing protein n=1 Tax=Coleophoma cylindrospora TaxID=1849047 RepID=A0A3D8RV36_9HELO|nr:hypothetical protein BP6252_05889 [Coleophoma cylindrospora]